MDVATGLLEVGSLAFPHVDDVVPFGAKTGHFLFVFGSFILTSCMAWSQRRRCFSLRVG